MVFHGDFLVEMVHVRGILRFLVTKAISADVRLLAMLDGVNEASEKMRR